MYTWLNSYFNLSLSLSLYSALCTCCPCTCFAAVVVCSHACTHTIICTEVCPLHCHIHGRAIDSLLLFLCFFVPMTHVGLAARMEQIQLLVFNAGWSPLSCQLSFINIHFICCSNHVHAGDIIIPIVAELIMLEKRCQSVMLTFSRRLSYLHQY